VVVIATSLPEIATSLQVSSAAMLRFVIPLTVVPLVVLTCRTSDAAGALLPGVS